MEIFVLMIVLFATAILTIALRFEVKIQQKRELSSVKI